MSTILAIIVVVFSILVWRFKKDLEEHPDWFKHCTKCGSTNYREQGGYRTCMDCWSVIELSPELKEGK